MNECNRNYSQYQHVEIKQKLEKPGTFTLDDKPTKKRLRLNSVNNDNVYSNGTARLEFGRFEKKRKQTHMSLFDSSRSVSMDVDVNTRSCSIYDDADMTSSLKESYKIIDRDCWMTIFYWLCYDYDMDAPTTNVSDFLSLSLVSTYFKDFAKIFYWKLLESNKTCSYPFHKDLNSLVMFRPIRTRSYQRKKPRCNGKCDMEEYSNNNLIDTNVHGSMIWDTTFSRTPHYYCNQCRNVIQCAHCVYKKDYLFTTSKDLETIKTQGNKSTQNRFKKHPKDIYLFCFICKTNNVVKRYLPHYVNNKFVGIYRR